MFLLNAKTARILSAANIPVILSKRLIVRLLKQDKQIPADVFGRDIFLFKRLALVEQMIAVNKQNLCIAEIHIFA